MLVWTVPERRKARKARNVSVGREDRRIGVCGKARHVESGRRVRFGCEAVRAGGP